MSRRLEFALIALVMLALTVAVVAGRRSAGAEPDFDYRTSSLVAGPNGSRALYDVLARMGVPVERRRTPLFDLAKRERGRPAVLVVLDPPRELLPAELGQVAQFVRSGGAVVVAGAGGGITHCVNWRTAYEERFFSTDSFPVVPPAPPAPPGLHLPPVADFLKPRWPEDIARAKRRLRGGPAEEDECGDLSSATQDTLLRLQDGRPAVVRLRYREGGSVTLVADAGYFRNRVWRDTDAPYFVTPLLVPAPRARGPVMWDEYHQRFDEGRSLGTVLLGWLASTPTGWAILQLVAVLLVALAVAAVRFGPPRRVIETRRRSPLEHLEALAAGLEGAAGVETAVALTLGGLRRRLGGGRTAVLGPEEQRAWLTELELALPTARGRTAARRLQQIVSQPGGPERALAAAQAVEDVWEELHPQTTRAGF